MKIIFFGSDTFAVAPLEKLFNSPEELLAVVTKADKKKGRHLFLSFSAVKEFAFKNNLEIFQPENLKEEKFLRCLKDLKPDLFVVAAYGKIIPQEALGIPRIIPLNIHASLLPKYRGAAPINWVLINGEKETGVTLIKMNELMDAGEIISQESLEIKNDDTAITLREKLSSLASNLLLKTIEYIKSNKFSLVAQNEKDVTYAPKLKKTDGLINWNSKSVEIHNRIRGLLSWPGSFTYFKGKILKVYQAQIQPLKEPGFLPGQITRISSDAIVVATSDASLKIKMLQIESGKKLTVKEFLCGHRIKVGDKLG